MPKVRMRLRELTLRYTVAKDPNGLPVAIDRTISTPHAAASVFLPLFQDQPVEVFSVLCLSAKHHVIGYREMFRGFVNEVTVQPREIFQTALLANAVALVVGHCHPSGDPTPSPEDIAFTKRLIHASDLMSIKVLDHIVTGDGSYVSFAESGLLRGATLFSESHP